MKKQLSLILALSCVVGTMQAVGIGTRTLSYARGRAKLETVFNESEATVMVVKFASNVPDRSDVISGNEKTKELKYIIPFPSKDGEDGLYITTSRLTIQLNDTNKGVIYRRTSKPQEGRRGAGRVQQDVVGVVCSLAPTGKNINLKIDRQGKIYNVKSDGKTIVYR